MSGHTVEYDAGWRFINYATDEHPNGYFAAVVSRPNAKRATVICRHRHPSVDDAEACARHLITLRTARPIPPAVSDR